MTELLDHHRAMLRASAVTDEVIALRGYWSAQRAAELERLGYRRNTVNAPALVLPMWSARAELVGYQIRPDVAPVIDGRVAKYLSPPGSEVRLDIPPACRSLIGNQQVPLWITEGVKKGDALASAGLTAVALAGVQMFRCEDWDLVPLDGRRAFIVFDSDVMTKAPVHAALRSLRSHLAARGAELAFVYLPTNNGKVGADDFLANGGTVEDLYALAEAELRDPPPEPQPKRATALPTAHLLDVLVHLFTRFARFASEHEPVALALFTAHTYALDAAVATPYVFMISPEKRSGKTRVLEVLELSARNPIRAANITAAGVFQAIEQWAPTLLVDEMDAIFRAKSEQAEALRAVLNSGNRRGSYVIRGTQDGTPARFGTFCCKALAGINTGRLPDTIRDRSIVINMQRRRPDERVEDLFPAELADQLAELRRRLEDWAAENVEHLAAWRRPRRVEGLDDRLQEAWDPLLAIGDLAQAGWPEKARNAATALASGADDASDLAHGHIVIEALRAIFGDEPALSSQAICSKLNGDEELPFVGYSNGAGIKPRDLAKLLRPYGIKARTVRAGEGAAGTTRGYHISQVADVWERYAPEREGARTDPSKEATHPTHPTHPNARGDCDVSDVLDVLDVLSPSCAHTPSEVGEPERRPSTIDYELLRGGAAPTRTVAELSDDELLAVFPGATVEAGPELESELALCGCQQHPQEQRAREWRLTGEALDVSSTYVSNAAHREAVEEGRHIVPKGKRSGWSIETAKTGHGHPWTCGLCHPPAEGLHVEWRDADEGTRPSGGRLRWRRGYGWRRDGEPDGEPLADAELSDEAFLRKIGGPRLVREWQARARQEDVRAGEAEPAEPAPEHKANWNHFDPNAPSIMDRYRDRPRERAEIEANVRARERLKTMSGPAGPEEAR